MTARHLTATRRWTPAFVVVALALTGPCHSPHDPCTDLPSDAAQFVCWLRHHPHCTPDLHGCT